MVQLADADSELYKNFAITISERWQSEIAETVFDVVNQDADKAEMKKKAKQKLKINVDEKGNIATNYTTQRTCRLGRNRSRLHQKTRRAVHVGMADEVRKAVSQSARALS